MIPPAIVERCARALYDKWPRHTKYWGDYAMIDDEGKEEMRGYVRAVLAEYHAARAEDPVHVTEQAVIAAAKAWCECQMFVHPGPRGGDLVHAIAHLAALAKEP